jgi:hypothetical protein
MSKQLLATGFHKLSERERRVITGVAKRTQIGGRAVAVARKDLDNDHAAAAARARRAIIGHSVGICCIVRCRWIPSS